VAAEPSVKRATAFFDGQNLFHAAKEAFGYPHPDYDPQALAQSVAAVHGWTLVETRFYTGIPDPATNPRWSGFWQRRLAVLGTRGVVLFTRSLKYRNQTFTLPEGGTAVALVGQEKGVDVRIALDIVRLAREERYDVALVFSQDQDLSEAAVEIREIAAAQDIWIKIASAFPFSPTSHNTRGINRTDWIRIDRATYDACRDQTDYFAVSKP
jgi:uncharacterized LabA/DUF88 family protein